MTKVCFQVLPMAQFRTLQKKVFPLYFKIQVGLLTAVAFTHPPMSLVSLGERRQDLAHLAIALGVSTLNLWVYGPRTEKLMTEVNHQGEYEHPNFVTRVD